ncbi:DnaJ-domain-containing protein [Aaosphaeria arxii CBS 175.79]|uniref:DnaJ-domain-containing protein n=1 Tax=Aaosphaeria arxii CBS 175.79 TaxID=1450172 RepID=A0A6A5X890_9PLEO|nr:DnaJ-domain-containing protein [Aaosphaeria arxii CBS 175.79]KAF2009168.1 DnaJ-domain-containing protein [Aaosphaeria arxii CBS 175.79]
MTSTLPPDPYAALGVPKDATSATIKSTYRKLVLKCHPDKVTDPTLKLQKQEEFHKIQQAYELIGDDEKRQTYDAEVRLEQLRKEKAARGGPDPRTARYETRTAAPAGAATYTTSTQPRYEERRPSRYDDDRFYEDRSRGRYETYESHPKYSSSSSRPTRTEREPAKPSKSATDRTRADHKKNRDKEHRRNQFDKFKDHPGDESSSADEKMRYEKEFRRRSDDARKAEAEEAERKQFAEARRKAETRRSYEETKEPRRQRSDELETDPQRKMEAGLGDAVRYIFSSRNTHDRPSPGRTGSSRDVPRESYEGRTRRDRDRPEPVRRSSARPRDRTDASGRERIIVDWDERSPPSFKHSSSSPADLHVPQPPPPQRSYTESSREHRRTETSPTPKLRRHETMPASHSASRRKEEFVSRPSGLRASESATPQSGSPPDHAFPTIPQPTSATKKYYYPTSGGGGVTLHPDDVKVANGHRTVLHEPNRRTRSPSPLRPGLSRPPMGEHRPRESSSAQYTTAPPRAPQLSRAATLNVADMERGRPRLFNEVTPEYARRPENHRKNSYSPDKVSYSKKYDLKDVSYASRDHPKRSYSKERGEYPRPGVTRHATVGVF